MSATTPATFLSVYSELTPVFSVDCLHLKMISFNTVSFIGILLGLLMVSSAVSAEINVGEVTLYSEKKLRSGSGSTGTTCPPNNKQWKNLQAVLNEKDYAKIDNPCDKCIVINGVGTTSNSRRHSKGLYAKIVDSCTGEGCEDGTLRVSSPIMKAIAISSQDDTPVVSWDVVECPKSSNLRGRKLI